MKYAAMSYKKPELVGAVRALGYTTVEVEPFAGLSDNAEADHADMQILSLDNGEIFLIKNNDSFNKRISALAGSERITLTENAIETFRYPDCVKLNILTVGRLALMNLGHCDKTAADRLKAIGYELVHINQGYARCSAAPVSSRAVITSDAGVSAALRAHGVDVLDITEGHIGLCGQYGGFIGGASFLHGGTLCFFGDISPHPDCRRIELFCEKHGVNVKSLSDEQLFDIGGAVTFEV